MVNVGRQLSGSLHLRKRRATVESLRHQEHRCWPLCQPSFRLPPADFMVGSISKESRPLGVNAHQPIEPQHQREAGSGVAGCSRNPAHRCGSWAKNDGAKTESTLRDADRGAGSATTATTQAVNEQSRVNWLKHL